MFTTTDYVTLHKMVFTPGRYSGYRPTQVEIPNGDGKADADKRFAHVAPKYMLTEWQREELMPYLEYAHGQAVTIAKALGIPEEFQPRIEYGALRILEYPPGAISNEHEDFDLFTLMMYRDQPDRFVSNHEIQNDNSDTMRCFNEQGHFGQLGTEIGLGPATPHQVLASDRTQRSIVYFAIPDHASVLPSGVTVKDWLNERMARSRTEFKKYE